MHCAVVICLMPSKICCVLQDIAALLGAAVVNKAQLRRSLSAPTSPVHGLPAPKEALPAVDARAKEAAGGANAPSSPAVQGPRLTRAATARAAAAQVCLPAATGALNTCNKHQLC